MELKNVIVSCESNDFDYFTVLIGSCQITYHLEYTSETINYVYAGGEYKKKTHVVKTDNDNIQWSVSGLAGSFGSLLFIILFAKFLLAFV